MFFRTRISVYHADVDITLLNTELSCRVEINAYTGAKKHKIENYALKRDEKIIKDRERAIILLEKLLERIDAIEGADVKDLQAGKKQKEAFSDVTNE